MQKDISKNQDKWDESESNLNHDAILFEFELKQVLFMLQWHEKNIVVQYLMNICMNWWFIHTSIVELFNNNDITSSI